MNSVRPLHLSDYKNIVVLTGAGISAESGLPTYRGPGGLWTQGDTAPVSQLSIVKEDPEMMWKFFGGLRKVVLGVSPNAAHYALAEAEKKLSDQQKYILITQNIDELHQRAGSKNVYELHGNPFRTKCSDFYCELAPFRDEQEHNEVPHCSKCGKVLRPGIVFFGEMLPADADWHTKRALRDCDLFIGIGTSGTVSPASDFVRAAKYAGARTILVNLEQASNTAFDEIHLGKAGSILPDLLT